MAHVRLDGAMHHVENITPYSFPGDNGTTVTTGLFGTGSHTVEFVFYLQGTTTEIGRASVTVQEGSPPTPGNPRITVVQKTCWMLRPGTPCQQDASKVHQIHEP